MKYLIFIFGVFSLIAGAFMFSNLNKASAQQTEFNPYRRLCVGIQGRFVATNWKGGAIEVGCAGDDGGAAPSQSQACTGEVQRVRPGERFRLTKCSCFGSDRGCLKIGKDLRLEPLNSNNRKPITVVQRIDEMPVFKANNCRRTRTGEVCGSNGDRIQAGVRITCDAPETKTPTPTGQVCPVPGKVQNVKITCPTCEATETEETAEENTTLEEGVEN
jgi:hypothetical protein